MVNRQEFDVFNSMTIISVLYLVNLKDHKSAIILKLAQMYVGQQLNKL